MGGLPATKSSRAPLRVERQNLSSWALYTGILDYSENLVEKPVRFLRELGHGPPRADEKPLFPRSA
jgi:hypothetical protein